MAPSRATYATSDASDDDGAAPESVTIRQSKEQIKRRDEARHAAESDAKRRRKEQNRRTDENLKKRALETRGTSTYQPGGAFEAKRPSGKSKESEEHDKDDERRSLANRMERALREAEDEENEDVEAWEGFGSDPDIEVGSGSDSERGHELDCLNSAPEDEGRDESISAADDVDANLMEGIEEGESSEGSSNVRVQKQPRLDYLPEHLFAEALSKAKLAGKHDAPSAKPLPKTKKEQKRDPVKKRKSKDIILGMKTIRTVAPKATHISSAASRTLPPGKVKRFYDGHLSLKSKRSGSSRSGWDRKAANIGIMRSSTLPAINFVRNR